MATRDLSDRRVAILATDGVEQIELIEPRKALENANVRVDVIAPHGGTIKGWDHDHWDQEIAVDQTLDEADPDEYDALVLPGGVMNPDRLRMDERAVRFARAFVEAGKPVASICHGPWLLAEADVVDGREMTSYRSIKTDLENAGARWVDREVVVDRGLVTSRDPNDLDAFNEKMLEEIAEGVRTGARSR